MTGKPRCVKESCSSLRQLELGLCLLWTPTSDTRNDFHWEMVKKCCSLHYVGVIKQYSYAEFFWNKQDCLRGFSNLLLQPKDFCDTPHTSESVWDRKPPVPCFFTNAYCTTFNVSTINVLHLWRQQVEKLVMDEGCVLTSASLYFKIWKIFLSVCAWNVSQLGFIKQSVSKFAQLSLSGLNFDSLMTGLPHEVCKSFKILLEM